MKPTLIKIGVSSLMAASFGMALMAHAATPNWNTSGTYVVAFNYLGSDYAHDVSLTQDANGNLTGNGGSPVGANVYTWAITSGTVSADSIDFYANYTATPDAVTPQTVMHVSGAVALDGSMSGTWSDNYQGGSRSGTWATTSGHALALAGTLAAEDFGVVNYDTGLGVIKGYSAGFGLTGATFASSTSVVVNLYGAGNQLLQTNTAILPKFNADITGTQFSTPFDVSGAFNYATDGYWTNVRQTEYGQSIPATRVVATVTLANGKVVTAENTVVTGDPTTIFPVIAPPVTTGSISGTKYNDLNRNGTRDANELGLKGWVIQLKAGTTTVSTTTDANGNYTFSNVTPGTYKVREVHQNGWKRMSANPQAIVITAGSIVTDVTFGNAQKQKYEREDGDKDDDRDDQSGNYFAHWGKSNYGKEHNNKGHSQR
jgi:hypothetical protein